RAAGLDEPLALGDVEGLSEAVRVPGGACAGREVNGADGHARRLLALGDRVDPDVAGEQFGRALGGRLPRLDFHGFSLQLPSLCLAASPSARCGPFPTRAPPPGAVSLQV